MSSNAEVALRVIAWVNRHDSGVHDAMMNLDHEGALNIDDERWDDVAQLARQALEPVKYVNAYEVGREYGGPEEGGWWYDYGRLLESVQVENTPEAIAAAQEELTSRLGWPVGNGGQGRYSVLGGEDFEIRVQRHPGANFPTERPFYE